MIKSARANTAGARGSKPHTLLFLQQHGLDTLNKDKDKN